MSIVQKALIIVCCHVSVSLAQSPLFREKWSFDLGPSASFLYISYDAHQIIDNLPGVSKEFMGLDFSFTGNYRFNSRHSFGVGANFFLKKDKQEYKILGKIETKRANFMSSGLRMRYCFDLSQNTQLSLGIMITFWEEYDIAYFSGADYWESMEPEYYPQTRRLTIQYGVPLSFHLRLKPYLMLDFGIIGYMSEFKYTNLKDYEDKHYFFFGTLNTGLKYCFGQAIKDEHTEPIHYE